MKEFTAALSLAVGLPFLISGMVALIMSEANDTERLLSWVVFFIGFILTGIGFFSVLLNAEQTERKQ